MYRSYCLAFIDIYLYKNVKKLLISSKKTLDNCQNSDICGYGAQISILYAFLTNKNYFWIHISHNLHQNALKTSTFKKCAMSLVSWRESLLGRGNFQSPKNNTQNSYILEFFYTDSIWYHLTYQAGKIARQFCLSTFFFTFLCACCINLPFFSL